VTSNTTVSPPSSRSKSSPEPDRDKHSAGYETNPTSHHESDDGRTAHKLSHILAVVDGKYAALKVELGSTKQLLDEKEAHYRALQEKYAEQRVHRIRDKQLVDSYSGEVINLDGYCKEVETVNQKLENRLARATDEHQLEIEGKERQIEKLKADHMVAIAEGDTEMKKWRETCLQKDSIFQKTVTKLAAERDEIKLKTNREKRKLFRSSRVKNDDLKAKMEALETKHNRIVCDCNDEIWRNEETITSLVARNQQLEAEHRTMSRMLQQRYTTGTELHRIIEANTASKEEGNERRVRVRELETHVENLLDILQSTEKDCTRHREAEQDMRAESNRAQGTIQLLEEKLALAKMQVRDSANQLERVQKGAVPAGAHCAAIDAVEQENEVLRSSLRAERNEKADIQAKPDKLDSENLSLSIEYDIIDAELIEERKSSSTLRDSTVAAMQELRMLRKVAKGQQGVLGEQDHRELLALVSKTTEENKGLVEATARMNKKLQEVQQWGNTVEDKCKSDLMKAKHDIEYWTHLYYNEAVPTTECLHDELAAAKAKTGEKHFVESAPPENPVVFGRKMLPYATMHGLAGVPAHLVTSAVHDGEFGTLLSATLEALKMLRPQGWQPIVVAGKVWLSRIVKSFSEEDAARRIQSGGHNASLSSAGTEESAMTNTDAPRSAHTPNNASAYNGLPADHSKLRMPSPTHTSTKRAHVPVNPERGNQVAVRREAAQPSTLQAPKPKPQTTRRIAQPSTIEVSRAPAYRSSWQQIDREMTRDCWEEWDDHVRTQWFDKYVKPGVH
jgi:hypothetical protein